MKSIYENTRNDVRILERKKLKKKKLKRKRTISYILKFYKLKFNIYIELSLIHKIHFIT